MGRDVPGQMKKGPSLTELARIDSKGTMELNENDSEVTLHRDNSKRSFKSKKSSLTYQEQR